MSIATTTHLNFHGTARAALEFYRSVFEGEAVIMTYGDLGMPAEAPDAGSVVFGQVTTAEGFRVMAYDIPGDPASPAGTTATSRADGLTLTNQPFFVSVRGETLEEVQGYWSRLAVGGTVIEALAASGWSPGFGMVTDAFGVTWVLDVVASPG
jgi:PhnB protein